MYSLLFLSIISFLLSLCVTPLFRNLYIRLRWVDHPDGRRKVHPHPIPRAGGLPIALSYTASFVLLIAVGLVGGRLVRSRLDTVWELLFPSVIILAIGILDDVRGLRPAQKFAGQFVAALLAWNAGVQIHHIARIEIGLWVSLPLTLLWLVGATNAFNLIDGLDGLATGIGLLATLTILAAALLAGNVTLAYATAPLAGALLGFLRYNFSPASVFLGDSGSLTIGFLLGCFGVLWSHKSATLLGMTAPLMALALPLVDTALAIVRRFLRRQPIFGADRGHIHHRLLDRGLSVRSVALLLYGVCGLGAIFSLSATVLQNRFGGLLLILFAAVACLGIYQLKYAEFSEAHRVLVGGLFRRVISDSLELQRLQQALSAARSTDDRWSAILCATRDFGLSGVALLSDGKLHTWAAVPGVESWQMMVPLSGGEVIHLNVPFQAPIQPTTLARLADVLRSSAGSPAHSWSPDTEPCLPPSSSTTSCTPTTSSAHNC